MDGACAAQLAPAPAWSLWASAPIAPTYTIAFEVRTPHLRDRKWFAQLRLELVCEPLPVQPSSGSPFQAMAQDENYYQDSPEEIQNKINVSKQFYPAAWQAFVHSL